MKQRVRQLLDEVLITHSPPGVEKEMDRVVLKHLQAHCDEIWQDVHGNIVGRVAGRCDTQATVILAHKDEIGTMVRRVDEDGKLWLEPLGGTVPWRYGEGPYDIIGDEVVTGVLSVGSTHVSHLSGRIHQAKTQPLTWELCYVDCKLDRAQLAQRGIGIGSRGVISRLRKQPVYLQDRFVGGFGLDDKAAVAAMIMTLEKIAAAGPPPFDVYFAATATEETGISGGAYVCRALGEKTTVHDAIAIEVAPVAEEYDLTMNGSPVVFMKDGVFVYNLELARELIHACERLNTGHQRIVARTFGSDTSSAVKYGLIGRAACIGFPTENTHGFEVAPIEAIENVGRVLAAHVLGESGSEETAEEA